MAPACCCAWARPEAAPTPDVLFVGLEGAGKTLLLQRLRALHARRGRGRRRGARGAVAPADASAADGGGVTLPTVGTELVTIATGRRRPVQQLLAREVGGQMLPLWPVYYRECPALVFVLDASDKGAVAQAAVELFEALGHADLEGKPVCLVVNKCDAPDTLEGWEVDLALRLPDLAALNPGRLGVIYASALRGEAVADVLEWMLAAQAAAGALGEGVAAAPGAGAGALGKGGAAAAGLGALGEGGAAAAAAGRREGRSLQPGGGRDGGG